MPRRGAILIIVSGLAMLIATLALSFLLRMRSELDVSLAAVQAAQARTMLVAACSYILEAGRVGSGTPYPNGVQRETFGWVDVRDGQLGPKARLTDPPTFPIGSTQRFPMYRMERPPYAIEAIAAPNPVGSDGMPFLRFPDVRPVAATWSDFAAGDRTPVAETSRLAWFRLRRESAAVFLITCGAGATAGFRTWAEVTADPDGAAGALFGGSESAFNTCRAEEVRLWYRVEWSPAIGGVLPNPIGLNIPHENYAYMGYGSGSYGRASPFASRNNACGTIQWIQRLRHEPADW